jgi:iron(II)-dependent oxidoreductase
VAEAVSLPSIKEQIASTLEETRARTLMLVEQLSEQALNEVHDELMSPIVWDLGHIANFEELWLVRQAGGRPALREELGSVYDALTSPRKERGSLPYLRSDDCLRYLEAVRERSLECLAEADLSPDAGRLRAGGYVYELIARHERQHQETILQTLQLMTSEAYEPPSAIETPSASSEPLGMVAVPGGAALTGASEGWFAYDNERPQHAVELKPFWIDATPVTNGEFAEFVDADGYRREELWSAPGWEWRRRAGCELPCYWERDGDGFAVRSFAHVEPLDPRRPVCHVSWFEADAYARFRGKRLPTEDEWERAASWDADPGVKLRYPWGDAFDGARANLGQLSFGTAAVGAYPAGAGPCGAQQTMGDVWEWTSSPFEAYEGFEPFPYAEYSQVFFDDRFKVLRGGSWATHPDAVTTSFRNWDYPERRQIFAGIRCASDDGEES